jgi:hypothetical protein
VDNLIDWNWSACLVLEGVLVLKERRIVFDFWG